MKQLHFNLRQRNLWTMIFLSPTPPPCLQTHTLCLREPAMCTETPLRGFHNPSNPRLLLQLPPKPTQVKREWKKRARGLGHNSPVHLTPRKHGGTKTNEGLLTSPARKVWKIAKLSDALPSTYKLVVVASQSHLELC